MADRKRSLAIQKSETRKHKKPTVLARSSDSDVATKPTALVGFGAYIFCSSDSFRPGTWGCRSWRPSSRIPGAGSCVSEWLHSPQHLSSERFSAPHSKRIAPHSRENFLLAGLSGRDAGYFTLLLQRIGESRFIMWGKG